jgi:hypothetical protein
METTSITVKTTPSMERVAENIQVFVSSYFGKQRPFVVMKGVLPTKPQFPSRADDPLYGHIQKRPLFMEGNVFRTGTYFGDVYRVIVAESLERNYYLFRVTREPGKTITIDERDLHKPNNIIKLVVESPGRKSKIFMQREGTVEKDIELISGKIKSLQATMHDLTDLVTKDLEQFVRAYYLHEKLNALGTTQNKPRRAKGYGRFAIPRGTISGSR